ncbi:nucleoside deaminase [Portibacter marinus]|uniref:nucleoside deaminase n=1 Tax=Portibacter marinus TaxID=2898660 RepID=UPI0021D404F8|nr:nucleoside deaminase [Portibacter marinus]
MIQVFDDDYFMKQAIAEAQQAMAENEIPVGAVIVSQQRIIARAHNQTEILKDVTAHAEMLAITSASSYLGGKYLQDCTMYITLEPCVMCAGALRWAQIGKLVYGATDDKSGFSRIGRELLHPKTKLAYGVRQKECAEMMQAFFKAKRS